MTPDVNEAAGRLRRLHGNETYESVYGCRQTGGGMALIDADKVLAAYLRETDPRLVDEAFIAGLAEVKRESNGWFADLTDAMRISCFVGRLRMRLWREGSVKAEIDITNPTIGDFYTACRLFRVTVTPTGAEA